MDQHSAVLPSYHRPPPSYRDTHADPYRSSHHASSASRRDPPSNAQQQRYSAAGQPLSYLDRESASASHYRPQATAAAASSRRRSRSPYRSSLIAAAPHDAHRPSYPLTASAAAYRDASFRRDSPQHDPYYPPPFAPSRYADRPPTDSYRAAAEPERHHYPLAPSSARPADVASASYSLSRNDNSARSAAAQRSQQYPHQYRPADDYADMPRAAAASTGSVTTVGSSSRTRRKQDVASTAGTSASVRTVPSTTRTPRAGGSTASASSTVAYKVEKHQLPTGDVRDVIILEDTPPPSGRTRAKAQAAAANLDDAYRQPVASGSGAAAYQQQQQPLQSASSYSKKRKAEETGAGVAKASRTVVNGTSSRTATALAPPPPKAPPCDDAEGHYIINMGDIVHDRYRIVRKLGEGTFGKVVECVDRRAGERRYAVKIIRAVQKYRDASKIEIRVLNELKRGDPYNENKCIHLTEVFDHKNHVCLVFELLGSSVFDFLKENNFIPFPMAHIQDFARQLLTSVAYMHRLGLVHTDLKPENILLADSSYRSIPSRSAPNEKRLLLNNTDIRLIDFGSATFEREYHSTVVSTRHYRAPEIIFGLGWSYPCDMFSIGCILVEFFTGEALFQTHGNLEHLVMMEIVMGKMPADFMRRGARAKPEFFKGSKLDYPNATTDKASKKFLKGMKTLEDIIPQHTVVGQRFCDLIRQLLHFDPNKRLDVRSALAHPFFQLQIPLE